MMTGSCSRDGGASGSSVFDINISCWTILSNDKFVWELHFMTMTMTMTMVIAMDILFFLLVIVTVVIGTIVFIIIVVVVVLIVIES